MSKLSDFPIDEMPRERLMYYGVDNLSNEELLMIIINSGSKNYSVKDISNNILKEFSGIDNLKSANINNLESVDGVGRVKAILIVACVELGRRIFQETKVRDLISCTNPENIVSYFNYLFKDVYQEEFYVLFLNNKKKLISYKKIFVGSINSSVSHPREIFKEAYLVSASFIICIHNHPSGDATPSLQDVKVTKSLMDIGNMHAIYLVDHIIVGKDSYYSFYEDNNVLIH